MTEATQPMPPQMALDALHTAAELNREDALRDGSLLRFPDYGQLVMTGDMHGNQNNFEKLRRFAMLDRAPHRHVIIHELIHSEVKLNEPDLSYRLMLEAALYKCEFPDQVHYLQSNHELAQFTGQFITKGGRDVTSDYAAAVYNAYGNEHGKLILAAMNIFIASLPLACRTANRIWISHSLPNERDLRSFDPDVVKRTDFNKSDLSDGGSVYQLVWGRRHTPEMLEQLAKKWDVDWFLMGHQPQETGFEVQHDRLIILASDHNHGTFLPIDLSRKQTIESLAGSIRKFVEVV